MQKVYESWFKKLINLMSGKGIVRNDTTLHAHPIRVCKCGVVFGDGHCPKCDSKADWRKTDCRKPGCKSHNAFVFGVNEDSEVFFIFCQKCNKFDLVTGLPELPVRFVSNTPPPLGSKTKPTKEEIDKVMKDLGF